MAACLENFSGVPTQLENGSAGPALYCLEADSNNSFKTVIVICTHVMPIKFKESFLHHMVLWYRVSTIAKKNCKKKILHNP